MPEVMLSWEPPLGSTNATYLMPVTAGRATRLGITTAARASVLTNVSMSERNSAPYSADAADGSRS